MAKIYIKRGYGYENANELCVDLFDNEDVETIDDIAHLVNNLVLGNLKLDAVVKQNDKVEIEALRKETEKLMCQTLCRHCKKEKLSYLALPCSHFTFCLVCVDKKSVSAKCPICEQHIMASVRVYI